jgi:SAM-dependent methyltransferase
VTLEILRRLRLARTARFWGRVASGDELVPWLQDPAVRRYVNTYITGDPNVWPIDGLEPEFGSLSHAISLGSGDGVLDRHMVERGICKSLTGFDISSRSLEIARRRAAEQGLENILYIRADLNELALDENSCDGALFQQSLHHVERLEACLDAVRAALRPNGLVYLDEYIGPSQSEWNRELLKEADEVYRKLPARLRKRGRLQIPVDGKDPSEAIRASEIVREISARFQIELRRDYGGTFLSVIYPHLDFSRCGDAEREDTMNQLIELERAAIAGGAPAFFTLILARKAA